VLLQTGLGPLRLLHLVFDRALRHILGLIGGYGLVEGNKVIAELQFPFLQLHPLEELPAVLLRDDAQRQLLENRRNKTWLRQNAADLAAKTIYAQKLLSEGKSWDEQQRLLTGENLQTQLEKIKNHSGFRQMARSLKPEGLADAMIQGVTRLAELYGNAVNTAQQKGQQRTASEISPESLAAQKGDAGLTASK
jgi:hypothetical protein